MVKMTKSFKVFITKYHNELYTPLLFGHVELLTQEIYDEYLKWLLTDDGKQYLNNSEEKGD